MQSDLSPAACRRWLAGFLAAAAFLGTFRLGTPGVWLDEASSWYNVSGSWSHLWQRALEAEDTGGILYSVLLKLWVALAGTSESSLRLPGVLLLLVFIAALARAATLLAGRWAGVCASAAALAHPSVLPAARQARGYILLLTLTAVSLLALAEWQAGRRRFGARLAAAAGLGAAATHIFGVFVALGNALWICGLGDGDSTRERKWPALRAASVAGPAVLFATGWTVLIGDRVRHNLESFWVPGTTASNYVAIGAWLVAPLAAALAWWLWRDRSEGARRVAAGLTLFALPVAIGPGVVSEVARGDTHFVMVRYAFALVAPAILAAGLAVAWLPRRAAVPLLAAALALSVGYSAGRRVYSRRNEERTGHAWRSEVFVGTGRGWRHAVRRAVQQLDGARVLRRADAAGGGTGPPLAGRCRPRAGRPGRDQARHLARAILAADAAGTRGAVRGDGEPGIRDRYRFKQP